MADYSNRPKLPALHLDLHSIVRLSGKLKTCKVGLIRLSDLDRYCIQLLVKEPWQASFTTDFLDWSEVVAFEPNESGEQILTVYLRHNESGEMRSSQIKINRRESGEPQVEVLPDKEG